MRSLGWSRFGLVLIFNDCIYLVWFGLQFNIWNSTLAFNISSISGSHL